MMMRRGADAIKRGLLWCCVVLALAACGESSSPLDDQSPHAAASPTSIPAFSATAVRPTLVPAATASASPIAGAEPAPPPEMLGSLPRGVAAEPRAQQMAAYLAELVQRRQFMGSVLVADEGQVLLNEGFGFADVATGRPNTATTQLRIGSLSKQFTAAAIMLLAQRGLLSVNDPVARFLPQFPLADEITIQQLLTHTAGLSNYENRPGLREQVGRPIPLDDLVASFAQDPPVFLPGQGYAYSSSGYVVLSKIIEIVSGQTYDMFITQELLQPAGMVRSGYDFLDPGLAEAATGYRLTPQGPQKEIDTDSSWPSGAGALYSTVEDLYRWDRLMTSDGLLSDATQTALFTPWVTDIGNGNGYGYGWEVGSLVGRPFAGHGGAIFGFATFMARFPEDDAVVIVLSNGLQMPPRRIVEELTAMLFAE